MYGLTLCHNIFIDDEHVLVSVDQRHVFVESKENPGTWHNVTKEECDCKGYGFRDACRHFDLRVKHDGRWPLHVEIGPIPVAFVLSSADAVEIDFLTREDPAWVPMSLATGHQSVPPEAATVMLDAMKKAVRDDRVSSDAPWLLWEYLAADYLGGK